MELLLQDLLPSLVLLHHRHNALAIPSYSRTRASLEDGRRRPCRLSGALTFCHADLRETTHMGF
jgi:hypothetical protein